MITPLLSHDALLADIAAARRETDGGEACCLWWLGQSGFLLQYAGKHLLLDPYLSDSLTKKYASTDKPHLRMTEICIDPRRLDFIDVVTASHQHTDHLDGETLVPLLEVNPDLTIVVPAAHQQLAGQRLNVPPERLSLCDSGCRVESHGFLIMGVPAAHEELETNERGEDLYLGYVVECGPFVIYHSGDTVYDDVIPMSLLLWPTFDLALLPINGRRPERRVAGNLWGREAASLAHEIEAQLVVPCHYDMFEFNTETPDEFIAACKALAQPYKVLQCGERLTLRR